MKTKKDPRHLERVVIMQELFAYDFSPENKPLKEVSKKVIDNFESIDQSIVLSAPMWPIKKINKIDLAVLRLAIYELIFLKGAPPKVIVDEAVELGKEYGSDSSASFINGALGKLIKEAKIKT